MWWRTSNCSPLLIHRPREDERLSWPGWLTSSGRLIHISGHPSATGRAQDGERTLARDWRSTAEPRGPMVMFSLWFGWHQKSWINFHVIFEIPCQTKHSVVELRWPGSKTECKFCFKITFRLHNVAFITFWKLNFIAFFVTQYANASFCWWNCFKNY